MKTKIDYNKAPSELKEIYNVVCDLYRVDIRKKCRKRNYVEARTIYFALCREFTKYPFKIIGSFIDRDHATCVHGLKVYNDLMQTDKVFREYTKRALYKCCMMLGSDYDDSKKFLVDNFVQLGTKQQRSILNKVKYYVHENMNKIKTPAYAK